MPYDRSGHPPNRPDLELMADMLDVALAQIVSQQVEMQEAVAASAILFARICAFTGIRDFDRVTEILEPVFAAVVREAEQVEARFVAEGRGEPVGQVVDVGRVRSLVLDGLRKMGVPVLESANIPEQVLEAAQGKDLRHFDDEVRPEDGTRLDVVDASGEEGVDFARGRREVAPHKWVGAAVQDDPGENARAIVRCALCESFLTVNADRQRALTRKQAIDELEEQMVAHDLEHHRPVAPDSAEYGPS